MIRPVAFGYNPETAINNLYQKNDTATSAVMAQQLAVEEFNAFAAALQAAGITVTIVEDTPQPLTPDSVFPNNWVSFHANGTVVLYPMFARNRRAERRTDILETIRKKGFELNRIIDLTDAEADNQFLEGTGSLVLDREHRIAYACISERTNESLLQP